MLRLSCMESKGPTGEARLLDVSTESADWFAGGLSWPGVEGGVGLPAAASRYSFLCLRVWSRKLGSVLSTVTDNVRLS